MELVTEREARDVDGERVRDVARHGLDRDAEEQLLEQATLAHTRRVALGVQRDLGADRDVAAHAHEVDVHEVAAGRVALDLAGERERVVVRAEVQRDQRVRTTRAVQDALELAADDHDRLRVGVEAVDRRRAPCRCGGAGRRGRTRARCGARRST